MATDNVYFPLITTTQLKSLISEINNNISDDYIENVIMIEQKKQIRALLGYSLYNQIQLGVSGSTLSTADQTLYDDYIKLILAYSVYKRLVVSMSYQLENAGLRKKYSDVSELAEQTEISYVRSMIQDDLDFYKNEMIKYICNNQSLYPLYYNDTDARNANTDNKRSRGYDTGWNISSINGGRNIFR